MPLLLCALAAVASLPKALVAAAPVLQTYSTFADLTPGKFINLSLSHDGRLTLAPQMQHSVNTGETYAWCAASDTRGNVYLGTGMDGKVYRISPQGDSTLFFDAEEAHVFAIAVDRQDRVYVATSPRGRILQVDAAGRGRVFCEPGQTYIWAMAFDARGDLWAATGAKAQLLRIRPNGAVTVALSSEAEHLRTILLASDGVYAGTGRPGLVYRIADGKPPHVLLDADAEEVHSLAMDREGMLYAATLARSAPAAASLFQILTAQPGRQAGEMSDAGEEESGAAAESTTAESLPATAAKSQLLRIEADGFSRDLWLSENGAVQVLYSDNQGNVFAGTGDNGRLYRINRSGELTLILQTDASHISAITATAGGRLALATSNMGRCILLGAAARMGRYESEPLDAEALSTWGSIHWKGEGEVAFFTRSGNTQKPEATWSTWQAVSSDAGVLRIASPPARFLQWRCELWGGKQPPHVREVTLSFIQKNRAPEITQIYVLPQGIAFALDAVSAAASTGIKEPAPLPKIEKRQGFRSVSWDFVDANADALWFALQYRGVGQKHWRFLGKELSQRAFSWDASQMADGDYELRITASDSLSLPLGMGLSDEKISPVFTVDNTAPVIRNLLTRRVENRVELSFTVCDALSPVGETWVSVNAGGWQPLYPADGLSDALCEAFAVSLPLPAQGMEITIKTTDRNGNYSVLHTAVKGM